MILRKKELLETLDRQQKREEEWVKKSYLLHLMVRKLPDELVEKSEIYVMYDHKLRIKYKETEKQALTEYIKNLEKEQLRVKLTNITEEQNIIEGEYIKKKSSEYEIRRGDTEVFLQLQEKGEEKWMSTKEY